MDFKNRGEAKVFKHEDPRMWTLTDLENGCVYCGINKLPVGFSLFVKICYKEKERSEQ